MEIWWKLVEFGHGNSCIFFKSQVDFVELGARRNWYEETYLVYYIWTDFFYCSELLKSVKSAIGVIWHTCIHDLQLKKLSYFQTAIYFFSSDFWVHIFQMPQRNAPNCQAITAGTPTTLTFSGCAMSPISAMGQGGRRFARHLPLQLGEKNFWYINYLIVKNIVVTVLEIYKTAILGSRRLQLPKITSLASCVFREPGLKVGCLGNGENWWCFEDLFLSIWIIYQMIDIILMMMIYIYIFIYSSNTSKSNSISLIHKRGETARGKRDKDPSQEFLEVLRDQWRPHATAP